MSKNKISFVSGEEYSLSEIFTGNHKIIIPDLQRDYCWGDKVHTNAKKELVTDFVNSIISHFEAQGQTKLNLGLIYGYELPENHIQLCDGQQRITTLYLLMGILNKRSENNEYRNLLISDFEYSKDDREPYLQYAIRESCLYFLSDLVCHYFIKPERTDEEYIETIDNIKSATWYYKEYDTDPSVQSMINAIKEIKAVLTKNINKIDWLQGFSEYVANKITFMYYDMGSRKNGEETFVIINTTGEPLTSVENLKAQIIKKEKDKNISKSWEDIYNWFWNKRQGENDTADPGFEEFLRWVTILHYSEIADTKSIQNILTNPTFSFPIEEITFDEIQKDWNAVKDSFEDSNELSNNGIKLDKNWLSPKPEKDGQQGRLSLVDCFKLLPLIEYCKKFDNLEQIDIKRLYKFFENTARYKDIRNENDDVYKAIKLVIDMTDKDILSFDDLLVDNAWSEEKEKLELLNPPSGSNTKRTDIEEAFWDAQDTDMQPCHKIFNGQIMPLIQWSKSGESFNLSTFKEYLNKFDKVFGGDERNRDLTRRALLARGLKDYPRNLTGWTNYTFAYSYDEWHKLLFSEENKEEFKSFFDDLGTRKDMIQNPLKSSNEWKNFIENEDFLDFCEQKNIQKWHDKWVLIKKERATSYAPVNLYKIYLDYKGNPSISFDPQEACISCSLKDPQTNIESNMQIYYNTKTDKYNIVTNNKNIFFNNVFQNCKDKYFDGVNNKYHIDGCQEGTVTNLLDSLIKNRMM
jgi:hypothetical protein